MFPILIDIFGIPIRTFGMTAALGFLLGIFVALREARRLKIDTDKMQTVAIWLFIGVIGGGRLLFVIVNLKPYLKDPIAVFKIWEGGLVLYGGLIASITLGMWQVKKLRLPFWKTCDIYFMCGMLGLSLARVGCLCAGDDWGRVAPGITVAFRSGEYATGTTYSWEPMSPDRAKPDIWAATSDPPLLYDDKARNIAQEGEGPGIRFKGFTKEPARMVIRIAEGGKFEYSTDGGEGFSDPLDLPVAGKPEVHYSTNGGASYNTRRPKFLANDGTLLYSTDEGKNFEEGPPPDFASWDFTVPGTKLPWAIKFRSPKNPENLLDDEFMDEWLHPTQLYLSLNVFTLFCLLYLRQRTGKRFDGELLAIGMILYPMARSLIEVFRGDIARGLYGGLSTSQWVSIPWFALGVILYVTLYRKARRREALAKS